MSENYLIHHGILGQKWGTHNGPPYPLGSSDHSSAEKKAAKSAGVSVGKSSGKGSIDQVKESKNTYKIEKKQNRIQNKIDKENSSWDKFESKTMSQREKNREKIEAKYDKKINKAKINADSFDDIKNGFTDKKGRVILTKEEVSDSKKVFVDRQKHLESVKNAKLKDFDEGTSMISKAINIGRENSTKYLNMKKDVIVNSDLKNSYEYKQAKRWYNSQKIQESGIFTNTPGKSGAVLQEAYANSKGRSATRGIDTRQKNT